MRLVGIDYHYSLLGSSTRLVLVNNPQLYTVIHVCNHLFNF